MPCKPQLLRSPPSLQGPHTEGLISSPGRMRKPRPTEQKRVSQSYNRQVVDQPQSPKLGFFVCFIFRNEPATPQEVFGGTRICSFSQLSHPVSGRRDPWLSLNQESAGNPLGPQEQSPNFCAPLPSPNQYPFLLLHSDVLGLRNKLSQTRWLRQRQRAASQFCRAETWN